MRDGVLLPKATGVAVLAVLIGAVTRDHPAGRWLLAGGVVLLVSLSLMAWRQVQGAAIAAGLWLVFLGVVLHALPNTPAAAGLRGSWWAVGLAGLGVLGLTLMALRHGRSGTRGTVNRWSRRSRRNHGVASRWQVLRTTSAFTLRRRATVLRPSLREVAWWRRWLWRRPTITELGTRLARVGLLGVWSPVEDVTMRIGGPRTGKSGELAGRILDTPGAVIATSTRTDLITLTGPLRQRVGPVYVFNPAGLGGLASTITFDPLSGCAAPKTATERAGDLLAAVSAPGAGGGDREFWSTQARRALAALLHAAALGELTMREVLVWLGDVPAATNEVTRLLRRSSEPNFEADAVQFLTTNDRTRTSITTTIMAALGWLTDPVAAAAARSNPDDAGRAGFDVAQLLAERGTVYMLGAEDAQTAPLVTALTGHIAREARRISADQPGGRLDPQLTLALDEAALICPVPLDQWTADMGGRNITIHIAVQSWAQLKQKYGDPGAASIVNNTATLLVYGGTRDPDDLSAYVTLVGERDEDVRSWDHEQRVATTTTRRVPVLSAAQIAQLPFGKVVIIRRGMPAAVGRVQMAWKRPDVRRVAADARWAERGAKAARRWIAFTAWARPRLDAAARWVDGRIAAGNAWLDRQSAQPDPLSSLAGWWRASRANRRACSALEARDRTRPAQDLRPHSVQDRPHDTRRDGGRP
jgi:type IV secretion system protein VirD4